MAKTLDEKNLAKMFMDRFLNRHYPMLDAIADNLVQLYSSPPDMAENLLKEVYSKGKINELLVDPSTETINMRALRNAWYHECALNYPHDDDERMKFPAWNIIQCYYAVFSSIAALVRSFDDKPKGHDRLLNSFGTLFLTNHKMKRFFVIPLCIHLNQDGNLGDSYDELLKWGRKNNLPRIIEGLERTRQEKKLTSIVTIPHYLKSLRDWASYEDPYLFFRLYGPIIRKNLDGYLRIICYAYIS